MTKILIAEDERRIRELVVDTLFDCGYDMLESKDGGETYQKACRELPDLIILDVMMPVMDGFEVLRKLRENPLTESIPVVMLTAVWASEGEQKAMNFGVRHYISKPFDPDTLESTVKVALREAGTVADYGDDSADDSAKVWGGSTSYRSTPGGLESPKLIPLGEKLIRLEKMMGGGIRLGSFTLLDGPSATGKSVLCQYFTSGALLDGHSVAYFASQHTPRSLTTQVGSIGLNWSKYIRSEKLDVYPLEEPITGEDSGPLLAALALDMERIQAKYDFIVLDAVTNLVSSSKDQSVIGFFSTCKRLCSKGQTIQVVTHSSAFNADLLIRVCALCETHLKLRTGKLKDKVVRTVEVVKVNDVDLNKDNEVSFEIEPEVGINVIPYSQVKV